jgi:ankyrin repeat protein
MENIAKAERKKRSPDQISGQQQMSAGELYSVLEGKDPLEVFRRAALVGDLSITRALLEHGTEINAPDSTGRTALMEAAFGGHTKVVELLISRGASPDAMDKDGWTALMEAASKGRLDVVRTLLKAGASVHIRNSLGLAALDMAAKGHLNLARALREAARQNA